jgi:hypothetical protein
MWKKHGKDIDDLLKWRKGLWGVGKVFFVSRCV